MKRHGQPDSAALKARRLGIDTYREPVVYLRSDAQVCRSEGFEAQSRIAVTAGGRQVIATLNVLHQPLLKLDEIGLSEAAWRALAPAEGESLTLAHPPPLSSFSHVRGKIHGRPIEAAAAAAVVGDIVAGRYSDIELASFITVCAGGRLDLAETIALTGAMVAAGERLHWDSAPVADKHCVGGLPGNRTTPLVVAIAAACGVTIPKTSSRAITSPAGTADAMETLAPVALDTRRMRAVVEQEGGCIVWGGAMALSPADDLLIRVERPLDLDSEGLLVASVLSKKIAAGSTHVVVDLPVGRTAKVRSAAAAAKLVKRLTDTAAAFGLSLQAVVSDGEQPVGRGIGPALEAYDVLAVLRSEAGAPADLRARALTLSGIVLELAGKARPGAGAALARDTLDSGAAWRKFQAICAAQGGMRTPPTARHTHVLSSRHRGTVIAIDNRRLATIAKLAGAPLAPAAGVYFQAPLGMAVEVGAPLLTIHAETAGELAYARAFAESQEGVILIGDTA